MFSTKQVDGLKGASVIRAWFEEGTRLKKQFGEENVYDFSLGNPEVEPPQSVLDTLRNLVNSDTPGMHRYMNNAGFPDVRQKIATWQSAKCGVPLTSQHVIMVPGAAYGLHVTFKALLNPGEEVLVVAPFFGEYRQYIAHSGGTCVIVQSKDHTFQLDLEAIAAAITPKTKAILINSPNNPSGAVYPESDLKALSNLMDQKASEYGSHLFLVSDEPYGGLIYDDIELPQVMSIFQHAIIINSFSKSMALAGERIGYIAVSSRIPQVETLIDVMVVLVRTMGAVNAPALFQRVIADNLDAVVDVKAYQEKRDMLLKHLRSLGIRCETPKGSFYLFPETPVDETAFVNAMAAERVLVVPGSGFGKPGHVRIAYCVPKQTIERSLPAISKAMASLRRA